MSLRLSFRSSSLILILFSTLAACGGGGDDDGALSASCMEAVNHSDLEWLQQEVFSKSCSLSASCHAGQASLAQGLNLETGMVEENTVGVPAKGEFAGGMDIVAPGDADNSYIMVLLGEFGTDDPRLPDVGTMPPQSDLLCQEKRDAIRRWIEGL